METAMAAVQNLLQGGIHEIHKDIGSRCAGSHSGDLQ